MWVVYELLLPVLGKLRNVKCVWLHLVLDVEYNIFDGQNEVKIV